MIAIRSSAALAGWLLFGLAALLLGAATAPGPRQDPADQAWPDLSGEEATVLRAEWRHFGDTATPEWPEAPPQPEAPWLELAFDGAACATERALEIQAQHLDEPWSITLNGVALGLLRPGEARLILPVPGGTLRDGANQLVVRPPRVGDDVTLAGIRLFTRGYREILGIRPVRIQVQDAATGRGLPARLAVQTLAGGRARLHYPGAQGFPTRMGVQYTGAGGDALLELAPGKYRVWAMHGMEWGVARADLDLGSENAAPLVLRLAREVDTRGWLAVDTHVHTYTFSGHGDASLQERILTLAGEGVEVAIATDHNHQTDYAPAQAAAGLQGAYLSITGNEVTTEIGHFNAFPLPAEGPLPDHRLRDWSALAGSVRRCGAQVVILNHPRWPRPEEGPFGVEQLDRATGDFGSGLVLPVDAIEIFNSGDAPERWEMLLEDWFALLNAGSTVTGVASSDSHTVGDMVGQGRTYVQAASDDPEGVTADAIAASFRAGTTSMSQGLFAAVRVQGQGPGARVQPEQGELHVELRVAGASWARATRADVFLNGRRVAGAALREGGAPFSRTLNFTVPAPPHDAWLVCLAQGPPPEGGWWATRQTHLAALTNPVWVDGDRDGSWSSPRATAQALLDAAGGNADAVAAALAPCDAAVRAQAAVLQARAQRE